MTLPLPEGDFKAFLFDCDGTIADSMPLHYIAWDKALREYGCTSFTEDLFYAWGGWPVGDVVSELNRRDGLHIDVQPFAIRKEDIYYSLLDQLVAVPEVLEHIHASYGKIPFAVVSGSTRESVVKSLTTLGLLDRFDTLVCAGDYAKGKPAPDPFLLAAERLGVPPANCLVFEDADAGIQSAIAAGMAWVKVPPPFLRNVSKSTIPKTQISA
jgi:HAD superfamily hydrolase (TIGR01509 family)